MSYEDFREWRITPLRDYPELSVVVPTFDEEERILPTLGAIASHVSDLGLPWELIVTDDGSTDRTVALVRDLGWANLRVLETPRNTGKGAAVRRGMLAAEGRYVLFADADQSTPIEQLDALLAAVARQGCDIAVGSRAGGGATEQGKSRARRWLSGVLRVLVQVVLRVGVRDTQCGFKLFRRSAARRLFAHQRLDGFAFDLEILHLAQRASLRVAEVPVEWIDAPGSKVVPLRDARRFLADLVRIRTNRLRGSYADV